MESILAIGVGLVLRIVVDVVTDNDDRVGGVLVGLWEGVVLNHFVRRTPRSFDPYLGLGFRIFVDFLFTQSLSRLALVALWALVGMLLAEIAPSVWRDSGLRHLYRQVRRDVRHVKRAVPRIKIKNDLPNVRLFNQKRSTSVDMPSSIRSDIATPSRSAAPSRGPTPGPARKPGRSPPGTFPNVSGWSETGTDLSTSQGRSIRLSGPSPSLAPSRERAAYEQIDTTHVTTSRNTTVQNTTVTITQTQNASSSSAAVVGATMLAAAAATPSSVKRVEDPLRLDPPTIPDDWVDINHPTPARTNEPVAPFQPDTDSTPTPQPGPSPAPSRSASLLAPPTVIILPDPPDDDVDNMASQLPDQIPLPESRAASVIGGVYDQPEPRSALRGTFRSRADKATSEIGVDVGKSLAQPIKQSIKGQSVLRRLWPRSKQPEDADAPEPPLKETLGKPVGEGKLDVSSAAKGAEPKISTPTQVDPPASILSHPPDTSPLLLSTVKPESKQQEQTQATKPDLPPLSAGVDSSPAPPQGKTDKGAAVGPQDASILDLPSPTRSPPPPFTEFAVPQGPAAEGTAAEEDLVTQDEEPTKLTDEQKATEKKRIAFLSTQVEELERARADLQKKMDREDDPDGNPAEPLAADLEDAEKSLNDIRARMVKKKFSELPQSPKAQEINLVGKSATDVQFALNSAVLDEILARDDAEHILIRVSLGKKKKNEARDAVNAFARRHQFVTRSETNTGTISIML